MNPDNIDWEAIANKLPARDTRIQTSALPDREYFILKAASEANKRKLSQNCQSLLVAQVRRWQEDWFKNIAFMAAQEGKTFEEKFVELVTGTVEVQGEEDGEA